MADNVKRDFFEVVRDVLKTVKHIQSLYIAKLIPVDRETIAFPATWAFLEETSWQGRNRLEMIEGVLIVETWISEELIRKSTDLYYLEIESAIHSALRGSSTLRALVQKFGREPTAYQNADDNSLVIIQRYPVTIAHTWGNQTTQNYNP
jgi:hypothetical protein